MRRLLTAFIGLILLALTFSSCRIFKKSSRKKYSGQVGVMALDSNTIVKTDTVTAGAPGTPTLSAEQEAVVSTITPIAGKMIEYTTFSGKAKMHYEDKNNKQDFTASIRMQKDSVIWVAITAVGGMVQVARVLITPDTIKLVNYLEKEVTILPMEQAQKLLPVSLDFVTLQNILVGNPVITDGEITDAYRKENVLSWKQQKENMVQETRYAINGNNLIYLLLQARDKPIQEYSARISLDKYQVLDEQNFSGYRELQMYNKGDSYYLEINYNNASFNKNLEYSFNIPQKYKLK